MVIEPKGFIKYWYLDENKKYCIRDDAPDWAKEEYERYKDLFNGEGMPEGEWIQY